MVLHSTKNLVPSGIHPSQRRRVVLQQQIPLLAIATYDATSTLKMKKHSGRGKLRFNMRQQMKNDNIRSRSTGSIYKSVFTPKHKVRQRSFVSKNGRMKSSHIKPDEELGSNPTKHTKLYNTLNPKSSIPSAQLYQKFITSVILFDAIIYVLSTEPGLSQHNNTFYFVEGITSTIFAIEYFARLLVCTEKKSYAKYGPIRGRWRYMCSYQALLDAFGKCKSCLYSSQTLTYYCNEHSYLSILYRVCISNPNAYSDISQSL